MPAHHKLLDRDLGIRRETHPVEKGLLVHDQFIAGRRLSDARHGQPPCR